MLSNDFLDEQLYIAFSDARKGKLDTADEYKFEMRFAENLLQLREDIVHRRYHPSRGTAFISHNPVDREIFAAPFRDRVVHHFIYNSIMDWWDTRLIDASYSCRKGRGTDAGIRDLYKKMRRVSHNFQDETVVVKIDLSSYFCSIPRQKLFERVEWGLRQQFCYPGHSSHERDLYQTLKFLTAEVIFDEPTVDVRVKSSREEWARYPRSKSLFYQRPGVGIVIGNLTSQMFSNVYLDQLDRFVTITLGIRNYGRYVDDAFFVMPKGEAREFIDRKLPQIEGLVNGMGLMLNKKKTFCQDIRYGIPFLGAVVFPYHVLPGKRVRRNFRTTLELVQAGEKDLDSLVSYLGRLQYFDTQKFVARTFRNYGLDYVPSGPGSIYYTDPKVYEREYQLE